jgi:pimeloyl-ACP methyl ester carboxylesterase
VTAEPEEFIFKSQGAKLYGFQYAADPGFRRDASVVMCHGLTNHHEDAPMFGLLRANLLAAGFDVFMFDFYGSGRSDGQFEDHTWTGMRQNLADMLDATHERLPLPAGRMSLVSRSVGASIAGYFLKDPRVGCSVLASPVLFLRYQFEPYRSPAVDGFVELPDSVERSGQIKGPWRLRDQFFDELEQCEIELLEAVAGAERVLVMHCGADPKVQTRHSSELMALLGDPKEYLFIEGGDHYYSGHEQEAGEATVSWLTKYVGAPGSG